MPTPPLSATELGVIENNDLYPKQDLEAGSAMATGQTTRNQPKFPVVVVRQAKSDLLFLRDGGPLRRTVRKGKRKVTASNLRELVFGR